jgi:hypothetical protein
MTDWHKPTRSIGRDPVVTIAFIKALNQPKKSAWKRIWNWLVER